MAKPTVEDAVKAARVILQDETAPYRYTDEQLVNSFNQCQYEIKRIRPDLLLGSYGKEPEIYTPLTWTSEIPFTSSIFQLVVFYLAGVSELRDDEFTTDGRAATLMSAFSVGLAAPNGGITR